MIKNIIKEELKKSEIWKKQKFLSIINNLDGRNREDFEWFEDETGQWILFPDENNSVMYYYIPWMKDICENYNIDIIEARTYLLEWARNMSYKVFQVNGDNSPDI